MKEPTIQEIAMPAPSLVNSTSLKNMMRENLDDFFIWTSDPEVAKYMTWEAYTDKNKALEFLINIAEPHPFFKAIIFERKVVGSLTLSMGTGNNSFKAELGYVLSRAYWGKGIATVAVTKALEEGFSKLKLTRIEALVDPKNIVSQRVLEKSGMRYEGCLKNHLLFKGQLSDRYLYSITKN